MANQKNDENRQQSADRMASQDLADNQHDLDRMKPETVTLDLPDVSDIPGQENITVPPLGALADTTISSDDEEGVGILDYENDDEEVIANPNVNVTNQERELPTDERSAIRPGEELK